MLDELKKTSWPSLYKASYFDCSDMSALLQRELAIRGFESWIVIGKDPKVPAGHAWVVVFLRSPSIKLVPVEATALLIPQPGNTYYPGGIAQTYEDYSRQGWVLQDIYEAVAWWPRGEFDWWNRTDILQKLGLPTLVTIPDETPAGKQQIEYTMPPGALMGSSVSYTKYLTSGSTVSGFTELTGTYHSSDWSYDWTFQVLGPGGESLQAWKGHWDDDSRHDFSFTASYSGVYKIRVSHVSNYPKNLAIEIEPAGWGYSEP
jgi:hypothetical protein